MGRGQRLDRAFADATKRLEDRERAFARELAWGVVRWRGTLDHLLARHVKRGLDSLDERVLDVLRAGAYEVLFMGGVPAYAAVSQAVDAVRAVGQPRAAGLVNAVLRRITEQGLDARLFPQLERDPAGYLERRGSHPRWLVERWLQRWSVADVARLVALDNEVPPLALVPIHDAPEVAARRWNEAGFEARVVAAGSGVVEVHGGAPADVLAVVPSFVQDAAAAWVCAYADGPEGGRMADLCAAPGGKAMNLARRARWVVAADPSFPRLRQVIENRDRTGLALHVLQADATAPALRDLDLVLVDAPCTGTGTLRRHPDARWRLTPDEPLKMAAVQLRLLRGAARAVAGGGLLVYSTCTLEPEENEGVVEAFLEQHPDFVLEPPDPHRVQAPIDERGYLYVLPQHEATDGAFAARLRRVGG